MNDMIEGIVETIEAKPIAVVQGEPVSELPKDLYIPPEALEIFLDGFSGPLDLLLYLIKRHNIDILDIPIAEITRQYMDYVELMKDLQLELAAEYLVMAATLAEIKSRMLLPRPQQEDDEDDPRAELVRRLQEYERFKHVAQALDELPRLERDIYLTDIATPDKQLEQPLPQVQLQELLSALRDVMRRVEMKAHHHIQREALSVRERMTNILDKIASEDFSAFYTFFTLEEGRAGIIVTFIALLELLKESLIEMVQSESFAPIYIKSVSS